MCSHTAGTDDTHSCTLPLDWALGRRSCGNKVSTWQTYPTLIDVVPHKRLQVHAVLLARQPCTAAGDSWPVTQHAHVHPCSSSPVNSVPARLPCSNTNRRNIQHHRQDKCACRCNLLPAVAGWRWAHQQAHTSLLRPCHQRCHSPQQQLLTHHDNETKHRHSGGCVLIDGPAAQRSAKQYVHQQAHTSLLKPGHRYCHSASRHQAHHIPQPRQNSCHSRLLNLLSFKQVFN
jgi:hypothetical protein